MGSLIRLDSKESGLCLDYSIISICTSIDRFPEGLNQSFLKAFLAIFDNPE